MWVTAISHAAACMQAIAPQSPMKSFWPGVTHTGAGGNQIKVNYIQFLSSSILG